MSDLRGLRHFKGNEIFYRILVCHLNILICHPSVLVCHPSVLVCHPSVLVCHPREGGDPCLTVRNLFKE